MSLITVTPMLHNSANYSSSNGQINNTSDMGSKVYEYIEWRHENLTFEQYGYKQSGNHFADPSALEAELNKIYSSFKSKLNRAQEDVERLKNLLNENLNLLKAKKLDIKSRLEAFL